VRRLLALALLVGGPLLYLSRRREAGGDRVTVAYDDGSQVTLRAGTPGTERLLDRARAALTA
jgi:hypothetical protein